MVQFLSRNFMELPLSCFPCVWLFNTQERHPHADHAVGQRKRKGRGQERQKQKEQQERWSPGGWVTIWTIWTSGRITSHNQDHENVMRVSCHVCTHFEDCHCPYLVHILSISCPRGGGAGRSVQGRGAGDQRICGEPNVQTLTSRILADRFSQISDDIWWWLYRYR